MSDRSRQCTPNLPPPPLSLSSRVHRQRELVLCITPTTQRTTGSYRVSFPASESSRPRRSLRCFVQSVITRLRECLPRRYAITQLSRGRSPSGTSVFTVTPFPRLVTRNDACKRGLLATRGRRANAVEWRSEGVAATTLRDFYRECARARYLSDSRTVFFFSFLLFFPLWPGSIRRARVAFRTRIHWHKYVEHDTSIVCFLLLSRQRARSLARSSNVIFQR